MTILDFIASLFYVQPSLLFTYAPTQIVLLAAFLIINKNCSWLRGILYALSAQAFSFFIFLMAGIVIVPHLAGSIIQFLGFTGGQVSILIVLSSLLHFLLMAFYLKYILGKKYFALPALMSNAIAAISVLALYQLLWR